MKAQTRARSRVSIRTRVGSGVRVREAVERESAAEPERSTDSDPAAAELAATAAEKLVTAAPSTTHNAQMVST
jgi:hypothetical protein